MNEGTAVVRSDLPFTAIDHCTRAPRRRVAAGGGSGTPGKGKHGGRRNAARQTAAPIIEEGEHVAGEGELALMRAVLQDAIFCLCRCAGPIRDRDRLAEDAYLWVTSRRRNWPFAFECICDVLDIDSEGLRRRLLQASAARGSSRKSRAASSATYRMVRQLARLRMRGNQTARVLR